MDEFQLGLFYTFVVLCCILSILKMTYYPKNEKQVSSNWKQLLASGNIKTSRKRKKTGELDKKVEDKIDKLVKKESFKGPTRAVAMDCEMVGVGEKGEQSILARVSIVNQFGNCLYDKYVKPTEKVTDYRTPVSGIRPQDIENAYDFKIVQKEVYDLLKDRILVGHALKNDLKVLFIDHPKKRTRDTSIYFRKKLKIYCPSLRRLAQDVLNIKIQGGEHDSVVDAQAAMRLYTLYKTQWENDLSKKKQKKEKNNEVEEEKKEI